MTGTRASGAAAEQAGVHALGPVEDGGVDPLLLHSWPALLCADAVRPHASWDNRGRCPLAGPSTGPTLSNDLCPPGIRRALSRSGVPPHPADSPHCHDRVYTTLADAWDSSGPSLRSEQFGATLGLTSVEMQDGDAVTAAMKDLGLLTELAERLAAAVAALPGRRGGGGGATPAPAGAPGAAGSYGRILELEVTACACSFGLLYVV